MGDSPKRSLVLPARPGAQQGRGEAVPESAARSASAPSSSSEEISERTSATDASEEPAP